MAKLDGIIFDKLKLGSIIKDGTAINMRSLKIMHGFGPRLGDEAALNALLAQLRHEEGIVLLSFHFLQTNEITVVPVDFRHDAFASILPL